MGQLRPGLGQGAPPAQGPRFGSLRISASAGRPDHLRGVRGSPGNSYTWDQPHDDLTVSLLQARLIELNLPIDVAIGTRDWRSALWRLRRDVSASTERVLCDGPRRRRRRATKLSLRRDQVPEDDSHRPSLMRPMMASPRRCPRARHGGNAARSAQMLHSGQGGRPHDGRAQAR